MVHGVVTLLEAVSTTGTPSSIILRYYIHVRVCVCVRVLCVCCVCVCVCVCVCACTCSVLMCVLEIILVAILKRFPPKFLATQRHKNILFCSLKF